MATDDAKKVSPCIWGEGLKSPSGLVYRDPALATLRLCRGECRLETNLGSDPDTGTPTSIIDTTDDAATAVMSVPIVQLGRIYVQPLRNVMFETSNVTLATAADGSLSSVGTQGSSAAASGFTALSAAASAQAQAVANRNGAVGAINTAIGAQNAAAVSTATFTDNVNKARADCLVQQTAIVKAGGTAVPCE